MLKADLASGYRQFGTHPVDWRFQVYCNGPDEHYIDLACPFGKTNSSLEFCPPVTLFAKSAAVRYGEKFATVPPVLGTHVDDIFGGFKNCSSYQKAKHFRDYLCEVGAIHSIRFNQKTEKTPLPARSQVILGRRYDSCLKRVFTSEKKVMKYRLRIAAALAMELVSRKSLEKLHGCLNYVAVVEPFGRPFLAHLTMAISGEGLDEMIILSKLARLGLRIWDQILKQNKGVSIDFILNRLPRSQSNIFVDASSFWGIRGCCGEDYFMLP